jgi:hypothetical protein
MMCVRIVERHIERHEQIKAALHSRSAAVRRPARAGIRSVAYISDERRLAATRRADERHGFAGRDRQRHAPEHCGLAVGVAKADSIELDARGQFILLARYMPRSPESKIICGNLAQGSIDVPEHVVSNKPIATASRA